MDMKEASAMTEASGLANDPDGTAPVSTARSGGEVGRDSRLLPSASRQAAVLVSEQLRRMTVKSPLRSLFIAFLAGIWVARRR
ncbi:MAG: hypothetical protein JO141_12495 [Bradyrhizobium sp.]|nr:hypothetical protein [Bradyrhizobium sp.]